MQKRVIFFVFLHTRFPGDWWWLLEENKVDFCENSWIRVIWGCRVKWLPSKLLDFQTEHEVWWCHVKSIASCSLRGWLETLLSCSYPLDLTKYKLNHNSHIQKLELTFCFALWSDSVISKKSRNEKSKSPWKKMYWSCWHY